MINARVAVAQGLWLAGLILLPFLVGLALLSSRIGFELPDEIWFPGITRFLVLTWGVPWALTLLLSGYLLTPSQRPPLGVVLSPAVWVGVAGVLWVFGMGCLLYVLLTLIIQMMGYRVVPTALSLSRAGAGLQVLLLYTPISLTGALALFAARKWFYQNRPPQLWE